MSSHNDLSEINVSSSEERLQQRKNHLELMDECLQDAKVLAIKHGINQEDVIAILAAALFKKRTYRK
ncbi:MAG: hypothetical protein AABX05_04505 [Nanoarchaeota archaeon]